MRTGLCKRLETRSVLKIFQEQQEGRCSKGREEGYEISSKNSQGPDHVETLGQSEELGFSSHCNGKPLDFEQGSEII